jgi:hypothetical protein
MSSDLPVPSVGCPPMSLGATNGPVMGDVPPSLVFGESRSARVLRTGIREVSLAFQVSCVEASAPPSSFLERTPSFR